MGISSVALTSAAAEERYVPPQVWKYETSEGSKFTMNRPTAGARFVKELPIGKHPIQLYSLATPNGQKVTILLEELLEAQQDAEYDAWYSDIMTEDQFGSEFVDINPNSKIPAMRIYEGGDKSADPVKLFESGSILLHLAEKYNSFLPANKRTLVLNWLFWQMGSAPYLGGGFGHFYAYAEEKQKYPIDRFTMEAKRQLDVLDRHLAQNQYMAGDVYTIADMAIFPWYGRLALGQLYGDAATFLNADEVYPNLIRWAKEVDSRPAVQRGLLVNSTKGLTERHDAKDFESLSIPPRAAM
jgi:GST-like protein